MNEYARLKKYTEDIQKQIDQEKELHKKKPNERMAEEGQEYVSEYPFWCKVCKKDFISPARRNICRLYGDPMITYRAKCTTCGHKCKRLISHRDNDPYYNKSKLVRRTRNEYAKDLLQPGQFGFNTLYGHN